MGIQESIFRRWCCTADQSEWEVKDPAKDATTKFNNDETQCVLDPRCEILWFRPTEFDKLNIATRKNQIKILQVYVMVSRTLEKVTLPATHRIVAVRLLM